MKAEAETGALQLGARDCLESPEVKDARKDSPPERLEGVYPGWLTEPGLLLSQVRSVC